jgi:hypothetical protein
MAQMQARTLVESILKQPRTRRDTDAGQRGGYQLVATLSEKQQAFLDSLCKAENRTEGFCCIGPFYRWTRPSPRTLRAYPMQREAWEAGIVAEAADRDELPERAAAMLQAAGLPRYQTEIDLLVARLKAGETHAELVRYLATKRQYTEGGVKVREYDEALALVGEIS